MTITVKNMPDQITFSFDGWLDTQSAPELEKELDRLPAVKRLVFDFSQLEYISSAGVRGVVRAFRGQKENGNDFEIQQVNPDVMEVFRLTGLCKRIPMTENGNA